MGTWFKSLVVSEEVALSKPQKEIFHIALGQLEIAPAHTCGRQGHSHHSGL